MAEKKKSGAQLEVQKISDKAMINENYFIGLLWSDPKVYYTDYQSHIDGDHLIHEVWGFFYELGKNMYLEGIKKFDPVTIQMKVKEYGLEKSFEKYGGLDTITDSVSLTKENTVNIDYYAGEIQRNYILRQLYITFGEKVFKKEGKYDYTKLTKEQLVVYWQDKVNRISLSSMGKHEVENLIVDADEFINRIKSSAEDMLPFYQSKLMNKITQGIPRGKVTFICGFGNSGKSSLTAEKVVMSFIANKEKAIIVLNEESADDFRQKMILSILNHEVKESNGFDRKHMVNGQLTDSDERQIRLAIAKMKELTEGDDAQIKIVFMENYMMDELESLVRYHANRGYVNLLVDTHKMSDNVAQHQRWAQFVEDAKRIYKFTRKEAGGLNLRTVLTLQLADSHIRDRYLTADALAEGKASKNEASIVMMFRAIFSDEYEGGRHELKCHKFRPRTNDEIDLDPTNNKPYVREEFTLKKGTVYYLLFTPKNRFGSTNDNGQEVLVIEPQFNFNSFKEIGWTYVDKDFG